MMVEIVNVLGCLVESFTLYLFLNAVFTKKFNARCVYLLGFLIYGLYIAICNYIETGNTIGMIIGALLVSFLFIGAIGSRLIIVVAWFGVGAIIELIAATLIMLFGGFSMMQVENIAVLQVICTICSVISEVFIFLCFSRKYRRASVQCSLEYWPMYCFIFILMLALLYVLLQLIDRLNSSMYTSVVLFSALGIFCVFFCVLKIYESMLVKQQLIDRQEYQLKTIEENQARDESLRQFKHDLNNKLMSLKGYLESGEHSREQVLLEELMVDYEKTISNIETGVLGLDALLNTKLAYARDKD
ncbi:MAG: hypothetical protein Q4C56_01900, partial [Peptococcaceae bacterium]|nr:hypothetical protein [Peptococcaceae bacterium]